MDIESIYKIVVMIFTVSNLAAMGLEINKDEAIVTLKIRVLSCLFWCGDGLLVRLWRTE